MLNLIKNKWLALFGLILLVFIIYYPALQNDYVWDDVIIFVDRTFWHGDYNFWYMISQPVLDGTSYFRPLVFATFVAEFKLWGLKPFLSHVINLIIFCFNVFFVYKITEQIAIKLEKVAVSRYAFIVTLLYITSPILIESTVWAVGRFDLMVTTFILLGVYLFLILKKSVKKDILLAFIFFLGLLCKELGIIFPVIILVFYLYFNQKNNFINSTLYSIKENFRLIFLFLIFFIIYMNLRISSIHSIYHAPDLSAPLQQIEHIRLLLPLNTLFEYLKHFIVPFYPNIIHQIDYTFISSWKGVAASIISTIFIITVIYGVIKKNIFSAYMALCFLICLFPVLRVIPLGVPETIIHERFMTTAVLFGLLMIVFLPWSALFKKLQVTSLAKPLLASFIGFYSIFGIACIWVTVPMWNNNLTLWHWAYQNNKKSEIALQSYLLYLFEYKKYDEFVKIINENRRDISMSSEVLYYGYLLEHRDKETKEYIDAMISALNPLHLTIKNRESYGNNPQLKEMGSIYHLNAYYYILMGKDLDKAIENLDIALWYNPENKQYLALKAMVLIALNQEEGQELFNRAVKDVHISTERGLIKQRDDVFKSICKDGLALNNDICNARKLNFN